MPNTTTHSRRDVLTAGVGLLAAGGLARASTSRHQPRTAGKAKNVIFMVSDGMSIGTFTLADLAIQQRNGRGCAWAGLWDRHDVRRSMMSTRSADSLVTDSAAAGSTWGCGLRVNNGELNWHDGQEFEPILVAAKNAGKATGVVSTARVTHATPASFYSNVPRRGMEDEIARQFLDRGFDLALGGGAEFMPPELIARHLGVYAVRNTEELRVAAEAQGRLVGVFTEGHMSYELDRPENEPHLREMSMIAIERLSKNPGGFVLQIEAGRVDHGGHANDFVASLHDQIAFDQTIAAVEAWADRRDDTLVIVTTDHGTGGPDLTVYGRHSHAGFETLLGARHTLGWIVEQMKESEREQWPGRLRELVAEHVGVELSDEEIEWATRPLRGERVNGFNGANGQVSGLGAVMANHFGVAYISTNHTAEHVDVTAFGPGAEALPSRIDNTDLHGLMTGALALPTG